MANMATGEGNGRGHQPHAAHNASANGTAMMSAYSPVGGGATVQPQPQLAWVVQPPQAGPPNLTYTGPMHQPQAGAMCTRSTFFIEVNPGQHLSGQMYVECFEPLLVVEKLPIILIHGDFHTGQVRCSRFFFRKRECWLTAVADLGHQARRRSRLGLVLLLPWPARLRRGPPPFRPLQHQLPAYRPGQDDKGDGSAGPGHGGTRAHCAGKAGN